MNTSYTQLDTRPLIYKQDGAAYDYSYHLCKEDIPNVRYNKQCLFELFQVQAEATPNKAALCVANETITYLELSKRAEHLATSLRSNGVEFEDVVAILLDRSIDMVAAILAVLKIGAAFILIDTDTAMARVQRMVDSSGAKFVLAEGATLRKFSRYLLNLNGNGSLGLIDIELGLKLNDAMIDNAEVFYRNSLAQVVPTFDKSSGAGVLQFEHAAFAELLGRIEQELVLSRIRKLYLVTSVYQSRFIVELFFALSNGIECFLSSQHGFGSSLDLLKFVRAEQIDVMFAPIAVWKGLMKTDTALARNLCALCVLEHIEETVPAGMFGVGQQVAIYKEYLPTALCCGLEVGSTQTSALSRGQVPKEGGWQLPVIGAPRVATQGGMLRSDHYLKTTSGEVWAWMKSQSKSIDARGVRLFIDEIEYYLKQHPAVSSAKVSDCFGRLSVTINVHEGYGSDDLVGSVEVDAKNLSLQSYPETRTEQVGNLIALAARLNDYLSNNLVVRFTPDCYIFTWNDR